MAPEAESSQPFAKTAEEALHSMIPSLPKAVRFRAQNALDHLNRAYKFLPEDREMASFCAITGEEEAAAALFKALKMRGYAGAKVLRVYNHRHKAAVSLCVQAIQNHLARGINKLHVEFDLKRTRIDVGFLLSTLGLRSVGSDDVKIQLAHPLDIHSVNGHEAQENSPPSPIMKELRRLAESSGFDSIQNMTEKVANLRNTLLYASDEKLPSSVADEGVLLSRRNKALSLIAGAVIVLQTTKQQALVCQALSAISEMVGLNAKPAGESVI